MEEKDELEEAKRFFVQAWNESTNDFEKFLAAHFLARYKEDVRDNLKWLETALTFALRVNDDSVKSAFPSLYRRIAECYEELGDGDNAKKNQALAISFVAPSDNGPFYHGTKADLQVGDLLTAGGNSNYKSDFVMNHIYFTAIANGAGLAAA